MKVTNTNSLSLSKRMKTLADMATGDCVADIGCDHAFVSMYLILENKAKKVIAMDVNEGPLLIAKANIKKFQLEDRIDTRLSNGFEKLKSNEADTAIIAGMGGLLMVDILKAGKIHTDNGVQLILQPQSDIKSVRECIEEIGYVIIDEDMIVDENKYYTIIKAIKDKNEISKARCKEYELAYGRILIQQKNEVLVGFLKEELLKYIDIINKLSNGNTNSQLERLLEIKKEIDLINEALNALDV